MRARIDYTDNVEITCVGTERRYIGFRAGIPCQIVPLVNGHYIVSCAIPNPFFHSLLNSMRHTNDPVYAWVQHGKVGARVTAI